MNIRFLQCNQRDVVNDFRKWRGIAFQILSETGIKESTRLTVWTTNFPPNNYYLKDYNEDSTDHICSTGLNQSSSNYIQGNYEGTSKFQFDLQFHGAYSFHNLIVNKYILYH